MGLGLVPMILPGVVASKVLGSNVSGPRYSTFSPPSLTVTMSGLPGQGEGESDVSASLRVRVRSRVRVRVWVWVWVRVRVRVRVK